MEEEIQVENIGERKDNRTVCKRCKQLSYINHGGHYCQYCKKVIGLWNHYAITHVIVIAIIQRKEKIERCNIHIVHIIAGKNDKIHNTREHL